MTKRNELSDILVWRKASRPEPEGLMWKDEMHGRELVILFLLQNQCFMCCSVGE